MNRDETTHVDPTTGGQKGVKLARFDLIPPDALIELAEHYGRGAQKHSDRNWERGYKWSLSFAALMRHAWLFWSGEDYDEDEKMAGHGKVLHLAAVAWHAFTLLTFYLRGIGTDDRPKMPVGILTVEELHRAFDAAYGRGIMPIARELTGCAQKCAGEPSCAEAGRYWDSCRLHDCPHQ